MLKLYYNLSGAEVCYLQAETSSNKALRSLFQLSSSADSCEFDIHLRFASQGWLTIPEVISVSDKASRRVPDMGKTHIRLPDATRADMMPIESTTQSQTCPPTHELHPAILATPFPKSPYPRSLLSDFCATGMPCASGLGRLAYIETLCSAL